MRMNILLALASASIASAQNNTNTELPTTTSGNTNPTDGNNVNGFPGLIGNFELYGCVKSDNGFAGWRRVSSLADMTLEFCAASCETKYFGTQDTDCYCSEELDEDQSDRVDLNLCSTDCPGDDTEKCGGLLSVVRRQNVPENVLFTVYVRRADGADDETTTRTVTSTRTGTITSCAPEVTDCVIGDRTVDINTITTEFCPTPTPDYRAIVCYGDECAPEQACDVCAKHRVICVDGHCQVEECDTEDYNRLVICEGDSCNYAHGQKGKVVCYGETCDIQECFGEECQGKIVEQPVCTGNECSKPAPPSPSPAPPCFGPDCGVVPPPNNGGNAGGNNGTVPPVIAGAGNVLPAAGAVFGMVAGLAALL